MYLTRKWQPAAVSLSLLTFLTWHALRVSQLSRFSMLAAACDALMGVAGWLEDGFECCLPLLALEGVQCRFHSRNPASAQCNQEVPVLLCAHAGEYGAACASQTALCARVLQSQALPPTGSGFLVAGCVLVPGETLPLRIGPTLAAHRNLRSAAIEQALAAPPPLSRLIAVVRL